LTIMSTSYTTPCRRYFLNLCISATGTPPRPGFSRDKTGRLRDSKMPVNILLSKIDENCFGSSVPGFQ